MTTVGFASLGDVTDPQSPQNAHYMFAALQRIAGAAEVEAIEPLAPTWPAPYLLGARKLAMRAIGAGDYPVFASPWSIDSYGRSISMAVDQLELTTVVSNQLFPLADVAPGGVVRLGVHLDATFELLHRMGGYLDGWSARAIRDTISAERRAAARVDLIACASEWAARSVVEDYGVGADRVMVTGMGANVPTTWPLSEPGAPAEAPRRFVFFGSDWERKGGPFALDVVRSLGMHGHAIELLILGLAANVGPAVAAGDRVAYLGRLNKSRPEQWTRIRNILASASLLILPTRSDCSPAAIPELAALGVPAAVTDVGGVSTGVIDGKTGLLFSAAETAERWAERIDALLRDQNALSAMRADALHHYKTRACWDVIMKQVLHALG